MQESSKIITFGHALGYSRWIFSMPEKRVALSLLSSWISLLFLPFSLCSLYFSNSKHSPWVTFLSLWQELSVTIWWLWTQNCKSQRVCVPLYLCLLSSSPSMSHSSCKRNIQKKIIISSLHFLVLPKGIVIPPDSQAIFGSHFQLFCPIFPFPM